MEIKLSNFKSYHGKYGVSIANSQPGGCKFPVYKPLQPGWPLVNQWKRDHDNEKYTRGYMLILDKLDAMQVYNDLFALVDDTPVLLCRCNKGTFCHRYLVAQWLKEELE